MSNGKLLEYKGRPDALSDQGGLGILYKELLRYASMLSFNDAFRLVSIIMICVLPLVFFMKKGGAGSSPGMH